MDDTTLGGGRPLRLSSQKGIVMAKRAGCEAKSIHGIHPSFLFKPYFPNIFYIFHPESYITRSQIRYVDLDQF